jgi:hypothetical protein
MMNKYDYELVKQHLKTHGQHTESHSIIFKQSEVIGVTVARFNQLKLAEFCVCLLAFTGFGCAAVVADLTYNDIYEKERLATLLEIACMLSSILLIIALFWRTKQEMLWEQAKGIYSYLDTLSTSGKLTQFLIEALINFVHPPVGLRSDTFMAYKVYVDNSINYSYTNIIAAFMVIRVYHLIRFLSIMSVYRSGRSQRLCQMNGVYAGTNFATKCMMHDQPIIVMIGMFLSGIFAFGYMIRIFERPATGLAKQDFSDYGNALWCIITTMTTVGYGDLYPVTDPGRVVGCIACIWGVLVISVMCVSLYNLLVLDTGEEKSLKTLKRLWFKDEMRKYAAYLISTCYRYKLMVNSGKFDKRDLELKLGQVKKRLIDFQLLRNKQRSYYGFDSYTEIIEYKIDEILDVSRMEDKGENIDRLLEMLKTKVEEGLNKSKVF